MAADERDVAAVVDAIDQPVVLFDGVCNLCNDSVRLIVKFDHEGRFLFAPLQSDVARELLDRQGRSPDYFDSIVLVDGDETYTKSEAALRIARELDGPFPLLYSLIYLPEDLRDGVYDFVADYRYRVFGRSDECQVPDREISERFAERSLETT